MDNGKSDARGAATDERILVTGGTGSFGHAFLTYALTQGVQEVRVLSRAQMAGRTTRPGAVRCLVPQATWLPGLCAA